MRRPACYLSADDQPLDATIMRRLVSLTLTDNRSAEADTLELVLSDADAQLELPRRGVVLQCQIGWAGEALTDMGSFVVDETSWSTGPDQITVSAKSADMKSTLKTGKRRSFHRQNLGQIASQIASDHQLSLSITAELANIDLSHVDQTDESDLNLLHRLCLDNGADYSIKQGRLLIFAAGQGRTASGQSLPTLTLTRRDGDQCRYAEADRDSDYTGVKAFYADQPEAKRKSATAGQPEPAGGINDPRYKTKVLKGTFKDEASAQRAAASAMQRTGRRRATFSITTAHGRPDISTESPLRLQGFKPQIDSLHWIVAKATHTLSKSGMTTQLELESDAINTQDTP